MLPLPLALPPAAELLPALLDLSITGVVYYLPVRDAAGQVVDLTFGYLNPAAQRQLHLPAQPAATYLQQFPTSVAAGAWEFHREALLAGEVRQRVQDYQTDGRDHYYLIAARRVGEGLLVSFTDTSEHAHTPVGQALLESRVQEQGALLAAAQHQVQQREELYQVFEQAPAAIMLLRGPQHRIEYVNPTYQRYFPGVALRGRLLAEAHPRAVAEGIMARFEQVYATGRPFVGEELPVLLAPLPGQPPAAHYFNYTYQPYLEHERTVGVSVFAYDVTEQVLARRAATRQLQAQQAELRRIFEQAPVGIYLMRGPGFVIELINETAADMWGTVPATMLGRSWLDIAPGLHGSELLAAWELLLRTGEPYYQHEVRYQLSRAARGKPSIGYFNVAYQPWHDEQNQLVGIIAVGIEVTEQVLARQQVQVLNDELTATNARLTHTNDDLDTFVYTASHDLKTPIANIEGLLNALREYLPAGSTDPLVPRLLDMMQGAVARFQQTIGYLTDVARLQHADLEPAQPLDLAALVDDVRLDLASLLARTRAQLLLDIGQCPTVVFAPKNLRSIVYNLLSNALKYHDPARPAVVQLRATPAAGGVVLAVQDNGLGLSKTQQGNLFTLFRRLHAHIEGSGVGLYMLKRIVENAGGTIGVHSEPGVGSTFTVVLPMAQPPR